MFGLFKKRQPEPTQPSAGSQQFQKAFATMWVPDALSNSRAGFSIAVQVGDGTKVLTNAWNKLWTLNRPGQSPPSTDGLKVDHFSDSGHLIVHITFPAPLSAGGAYSGIVVLGPCDDPEWGNAARANLPFRYFILFRGAEGTRIEEWTTNPPIALGSGPGPDPIFFIEWVLNHTIRSAADSTVTVRSGDEDLAAAIAKARSELPNVLQQFIAGALHDANFTVKVSIKEHNFTEHFWLSETTFSDGIFSGIIESEPQSLSIIKQGDRWTAPIEEVTDWMYAKNQKMYGNYTLRALLPKMPPHEAAKYRAVLSD